MPGEDQLSESNLILEVTEGQVESVYDGRVNRCACGCSGTYWGPDYTDAGPEENARMVRRILARMQRRARKAIAGEVDPLGYYRFNDGSECWYYDTKTRLIRLGTKGK